MTRFLRFLLLTGFMLMSTSAIVGTALADSLFPTVNLPTDESLKCIQPREEMRKNHMNYIMHQRDLTVHDGIRTKTNSLHGCIDCHVESDKDGHVAKYGTSEHFCSTCHIHTAVKIDCFQCHADRPQKYIERKPQVSSLIKQLQQTLAATNEVDQ